MISEEKMFPRGKPRFPTGWTLLALALLACGVTLWGIGEKSLTYDEIDQVYLSSRPLAEIVRFHATMVANAPGYYLLQHLLLPLGRSELALRLPSVVFGAGCVLATYAFGVTLFGPAEGLLAATLLALSPLHVTLSQQTRMYPMFELLAVLSCLGFYRMLAFGRRRDIAFFVLASALAFHIHYLSVVLFTADALLFVGLVIVRPQRLFDAGFDARRTWRLGALSGLLVAGICLPWILRTGILSRLPIVPPPWDERTLGGDIAETLFSFGAASLAAPELIRSWMLAIPRVFFVGLFFACFPLAVMDRDEPQLSLLVWLSLAVASLLAASRILDCYYESRFASFLLPLWTLVLARGTVRVARALVPSHSVTTFTLVAALLFGLVSSPTLLAGIAAPGFDLDRWREAAELLEKRAGPEDGIVLLDIAGPPVTFYLERRGLAPRARRVSSWAQLRQECAAHPASLFALLQTPLYPPTEGAKRWLLDRARWQRTLSVQGLQRLVVGRLDERCDPPTTTPQDPPYWTDLAIPCPPMRRMQMLYFLAVAPNGPIQMDSILDVERQHPGPWTEEKVRLVVDRLTSGG